MYYHIAGFLPRTDMSMGAHGFCIYFDPRWKELVAKAALTQELVDQGVENNGRAWLDICGYSQLYDPDDPGFHGFDVEARKPYGPNVRPLHEPRSVRVSWGEWGPEHITVPGNACGLDFDTHVFGSPLEGPGLLPHNIDCWSQKHLLLATFLFFADQVLWRSSQ